MAKCLRCSTNISFVKEENKLPDGSILCKNCISSVKAENMANTPFSVGKNNCNSCGKKIGFIKQKNKLFDGRLICDDCLKIVPAPSFSQMSNPSAQKSSLPEPKFSDQKQEQTEKVITNTSQPSSEKIIPKSQLAEKLRELSSLKDEGLLTDEEFKLAKKKLLEKLE